MENGLKSQGKKVRGMSQRIMAVQGIKLGTPEKSLRGIASIATGKECPGEN